MWKFWSKKQWTNRKIAFVAILIATSVAFVLIFSRIAPIASLPSFKIMFGGLPVKITGYIFGPLIGALTGVISDLISFAMNPVYYHGWYTLAFAVAGAVPGVVAYLMHRRWKNKGASAPEDEVKYNNINFVITIGVLLAVIAAITTFVLLQDDSVFAKQKLISNKHVFLAIAIAGTSTMLVAVVVFRFVFKPKTFNALLPIIVFSALIEVINTPIVTLGDRATIVQDGDSFLTLLTAHFLLSPVKIWGNLLIIYFAYKVIAPLIFNKTGNGWDQQEEPTDLVKIKKEKRAKWRRRV